MLALLLCLAPPAAAQDAPGAPPVLVRESLEPASGIVIGQRVALRVDVLFRDDMPRPPRVSLPEVAGLQVLRFETQGLTMRETIAGAPYVGQRFEFALYARRGGSFQIGPAAVTLLDRQGAVTGTAQGQVVALEVEVPPGIDPSGPVVATSALTLTEQWTPGPGTRFHAGDAIVRTITRTAEDVPGLAMRDLVFAAPDGVRTYVDPPDMADRSNRGVVTGRRVDRVTYLFERGGSFVLPAVSQPWWDLATGTAKTAEAGAVTIAVEAPPAVPPPPHRWGLVLLAAAVAVLLLIVRMAMRRRADTPARAERDAFEGLRAACTAADPPKIYRAFVQWRGHLDPGRRRAADGATAELDAALFSGRPAAWDSGKAKNLMRRLAAIRSPSASHAGPPALPPLNP
ncbi:hypothetical protein ACLBXM_03295 [Xanthobacteraceae bacterium A53D]